MNEIETGRVLDMIAAHYWQADRKSATEKALMVATWASVFADVPQEPHVNLALADWFAREKWPPQASELRALAMELGGPTRAMIANAELRRLCDNHWMDLIRDPSVEPRDRQGLQDAFVASLESGDRLVSIK